jgi:hypothetical protein
MSEIRDTIADVISDRETMFGDVFKNLRTGRTFWAEASDLGFLALSGASTKDLREKIKFWTSDRDAAEEMLETDNLLFNGVSLMVLPDSRVDNPASPQVSFECIKITAKDAP